MSKVSTTWMPGCLREHLLHAVEPPLQVGGAEARDHRDRSLAVEQLDRLLAHDPAAGLCRRRRRRRSASTWARRRPRSTTGMPASMARLMVSVRKSPFSAGDRDAVHALRDERLENLLLLELVGGLRRAPDHLDVAELLGGALGADLRVVEDREVERLGITAKRSLRGASAGGVPLPPQATIVAASTATSTAQLLHQASHQSSTVRAQAQFGTPNRFERD